MGIESNLILNELAPSLTRRALLVFSDSPCDYSGLVHALHHESGWCFVSRHGRLLLERELPVLRKWILESDLPRDSRRVHKNLSPFSVLGIPAGPLRKLADLHCRVAVLRILSTHVHSRIRN